jgi:hypothetical protein
LILISALIGTIWCSASCLGACATGEQVHDLILIVICAGVAGGGAMD